MAIELAGWTHAYSGKVRDLYVPADTTVPEGASPLSAAEFVLVVASDRVSAFDFVLSPGITSKGALLTSLSRWWFDQLDNVPNHLVSPADAAAAGLSVPAEVAERSMLCKTLDMYPIEAVVRGYLVGSGWLEYQQSQSVCGVPLPAGLQSGDRLPEPIYTPAFKAELGDHDENISFERTVELVGPEVASAIRNASLSIFATAAELAEQRGVILADTKFEFGADRKSGELTLADEVLTSDSSRYWDAAVYASGNRTDSFDKQIVRNWLAANWNRVGDPPELPADIVAQTAERYRELLERMTGE